MRAALIMLCLLGVASAASGDGAVVSLRVPAQLDVSVYEPGQKALIGWNGTTEVLILSTDVAAQEQTKALQIVPLPSEPKVSAASFDAFAAAERAMRRHAPSFYVAVDHDGQAESAGGPEGSPTILFHKKIGAHDITVARAAGLPQFLEWAGTFVARLGPERPDFGVAFQDAIVRLLGDGVTYFAFDVLDLEQDVGSVRPVSYVFDTDQLYYPLKISSVVEGSTDIQLFLITRFRLDLDGISTPLGLALYSTFEGQQPVRFALSRSEIGEISDHVAAVLGGRDGHFAALRYRGPLAALAEDLRLDFEEQPFDPRARELFLRKEK